MDVKTHARILRKNMTDAEHKMWWQLRNRRFNGLKFRRQESIGNYIVDFVSIEVMMVIEIDGGQHAKNIEYDRKRTRFIESKGYKVLRFWNNEVIENIEGVFDTLTLTLTLSQREREL